MEGNVAFFFPFSSKESEDQGGREAEKRRWKIRVYSQATTRRTAWRRKGSDLLLEQETSKLQTSMGKGGGL